jgi:hypothetical protein
MQAKINFGLRRWMRYAETSSYKKTFKPLKRLIYDSLNLFRGFQVFRLAWGFEPQANDPQE